MVYIVQIIPPFKHARYYVGYCERGRLIKRFTHHKQGTGARLLAHASKAGHRLELVAVQPTGTRKLEREVKNHKNTPRFLRSLQNSNDINPWILCIIDTHD